MIILDTNIISELFRKVPAPQVMTWLAGQPVQELVTTSITIAELRFGAQSLPKGKRRDTLNAQITVMLKKQLIGTVLPFGQEEAEMYGGLAADLRRRGVAIGMADKMISSITLLQDATLATRNTKDFLPCGVKVVDPFNI
jgi:predicted nucleic acid-binding protein